MNIADINWGSVADWVSGLGSLSAVITALYLANYSQRIRLRGHAGLRMVVGGGEPAISIISFSVTNTGNRPTVINNISMRVGFFKKKYAIITTSREIHSSPMPCPLSDGEEANWNIPIGEKKVWLVDLCSKFILTPSDVRTLKFRIHTTNGGHISLKLELSLRKELLTIVKSSKNG